QFNKSPREYRQEALQRPSEEPGIHHVNRGWPHAAITAKRQRPAVFPDADFPPTESGEDLHALFDQGKSASRSHVLRATDKTVHWGYFSRALPPVLEIASGDIVTVEVVTQHANDDA